MYENLSNKYFILNKELNKGNFTVEDEVDNLQDAMYTIKQLLKENTLQKIYKTLLTEYFAEKNLQFKIPNKKFNVDDLSALFVLGKLLFASN